MKISVIMPVRNGEHTLSRQLDALAGQRFTGAWEVLVSDNGSIDRTVDVADGYSDRLPIRVIDSGERPGISFARNRAGAEAKGDVLLFCDCDDVVDEEWVAAMAAAAGEYDVVGGRLETQLLNDEVSRSWRSPIAEDALPVAFAFLPFAVGANLGVRRSAFEELGGFDEVYRICGDDVDFCWRAQLQSMTLGYAAGALVHYQLRSDLRQAVRQQYSYGSAGAMLVKRFRGRGLSAGESRRAILFYLVSRFPNLARDSARRGYWLTTAAYEAGRVVGRAKQWRD